MNKTKVKSKKIKDGVRVFMCLWLFVINFPAQTGGQFSITQSVIANGGAESNGGNFGVVGTAGQANAGTTSTDGNFSVTGGFWQSFFAPTVALVSVSGRVAGVNGSGISKVQILLTDSGGTTRIVTTNSFGFYRFEGIAARQTVIVSLRHKRYVFIPDTQVLNVSEDLTGINFTAIE